MVFDAESDGRKRNRFRRTLKNDPKMEKVIIPGQFQKLMILISRFVVMNCSVEAGVLYYSHPHVHFVLSITPYKTELCGGNRQGAKGLFVKHYDNKSRQSISI